MGANFQYEQIKVIGVKELEEQYSEIVSQLEAEYGSNPYSGQLSALPHKIEFTSHIFDDVQSAADWIVENHEKWESPLAVRVPDGWVVGGWCPS